MRRPITIILSVIAVILVASISLMRLMGPKVGNTFSLISSNDLGYGMGGGGAPEVDVYAPAPAMEAPSVAFDSASRQTVTSNGVDVVAQQVERKVIKDASLSVVVKDPEESMNAISALAEQLGGYVVSSSLSQQTYGPNNVSLPGGSITIRIPAEKLNDVMTQIKTDAVEVTSENISGQDVTDQYVDLQSRLSAMQAAEKKLLEILEKAEKTEDVLAVYQQLQQVQSEIEVLKGQIKYIDQAAAMSSVNVNLTAEESIQPIQVGPWKPQGAAKQAVEDLAYFFRNFVEFLIRFVIFTLPALIMIAIPLFLLYLAGRAIYRRFKKSTVNAEVREEEKK
jgi:hypothetical protein